MPAKDLTIQEFVKYLTGKSITGAKASKMFYWPGDLFAICAALLEKSGAYTHVGVQSCPMREGGWKSLDARRKDLAKVARQWRRMLADQVDADFSKDTQPFQAPQQVQAWWSTVVGHATKTVGSLRESPTPCGALLNLVAICDETMAGVGLFSNYEKRAPELNFYAFCENLLFPNVSEGTEAKSSKLSPTPPTSTLCLEILPSRLRVLPKSQTPKSGLSLRSLSHYLSLCPPVDIDIRWFSYGPDKSLAGSDSCCNILVVPWPFTIAANQFFSVLPKEIDAARIPPAGMPEMSGWFGFRHQSISTGELVQTIEALVAKAKVVASDVNMVVLPELALSRQQFERLRDTLFERHKLFLISGVQSTKDNVPTNEAIVAFPTESGKVEYSQQKHHRWRLDRDQIIRYGLAGQLDVDFDWWEAIAISARQVNFLTLKPWLSTCVLICEDLAQFDPVGRVVRSVAPDLVVSLLMDGPQLNGRWPARYATVLADDPGTAVLTVTSLGMTLRSPEHLGSPTAIPRTVGLWRDPISGTIPITLPVNSCSALLTVSRKDATQWSADGRENVFDAGSPILTSVTYI